MTKVQLFPVYSNFAARGMRVGVVGINSKSSELALREQLAKAAQKICAGGELEMAFVLLSTCNRTEIYFSSTDLPNSHSEVLYHLRQEIAEAFEHKLYSYFGGDCFAHLAKVTAGLDSVIVGETEIQRQVKVAYENGIIWRALPAPLHFLFQKCLKIGKEVRSHFSFARGSSHLEGMVFRLSLECIEGLKEAPILFVGNSEINRKILSFFRSKGAKNITLCTRTLHAAEELKGFVKLVDWQELSSWKKYPLVICGTHQNDYLIHFEEEMDTRLIFDLSVPRVVDPKLARHPQVTLLNMEQMGQLLSARQNNHLKEIEECEAHLSVLVERQLELFSQREKVAL